MGFSESIRGQLMTNLFLIGERWGPDEERERAPFCGGSGYLLTKMLEDASISRADCYLTNVLNFRPPADRLENVCGTKPEGIPGYPAITKGLYLLANYQSELDRLSDEILSENPNLIICLGAVALWALTGKTAITKLRGVTDISTHTVTGFKLLPTYHPAYISRNWSERPVTVLDLMKAKRESEFPEIRRPNRQIWIEPTLTDLELFYETYIQGCQVLSVDIETSGTRITCIGFAPSSGVGIVIPFTDRRKRGGNYWLSVSDELLAWVFIKRILENPSIHKLFQNGLYDITFLFRAYGIKVAGAEEDTMLLHHALQPEALKGLGYLGSVYTDEGSWKSMRKVETVKKDD